MIRSIVSTHTFKLTTSSLLLLILMTTGCQSASQSSAAMVSRPDNGLSAPSASNANRQMSKPQTLTQQALRIQHALATKDFLHISHDIHPIRGVRFSMYAYVRPEADKTFSREQFSQYLEQSDIRFTWGKKDGTGDPLVTPLPMYLDTWVDGKTFNNTDITINNSRDYGNLINNLREVYPNSEVVEFYHKGTEKYAGMDWRVLRLVFDEYQGQRYLVAIVNDQWTI